MENNNKNNNHNKITGPPQKRQAERPMLPSGLPQILWSMALGTKDYTGAADCGLGSISTPDGITVE